MNKTVVKNILFGAHKIIKNVGWRTKVSFPIFGILCTSYQIGTGSPSFFSGFFDWMNNFGNTIYHIFYAAIALFALGILAKLISFYKKINK